MARWQMNAEIESIKKNCHSLIKILFSNLPEVNEKNNKMSQPG
jgi:hypothetical protein